MSALELIIVDRPAAVEDDVEHIVCHCTDDNVAACRKDVTDSEWSEMPDDRICALCLLAWPIDAPTCPWGCACEECGPGESE